ncbi:MAG TPA: hypothetical protein VL995_01255 [Cellvibrio sp.]|nr:hypothetical protein [Cellvibrio sp.]
MYKKCIKWSTVSIIALSSTIVAAGNLTEATVAFKSGNWKVLRSTDQMTDKTNCTGIYKEDYGTQLVSDSLFLPARGGVEAVTLRFGDSPAEPLRLASDMEKKVGFVIVTGTEFSKLIASNKLRYQISTLVNGIISAEIDLTGAKEALASINAGCPISEKAEAPKKLENSLCSEKLVSNMKAQGLKEAQIHSICNNN